MTEAITRAQNIAALSAQSLLMPSGNDKLYFDLGETYPSSDTLPLHTVVSVKQDGGRTIVLYNPLAQERVQMVTVTVDSPNIMVGSVKSLK